MPSVEKQEVYIEKEKEVCNEEQKVKFNKNKDDNLSIKSKSNHNDSNA